MVCRGALPNQLLKRFAGFRREQLRRLGTTGALALFRFRQYAANSQIAIRHSFRKPREARLGGYGA
jgi:hypothetical protein